MLDNVDPTQIYWWSWLAGMVPGAAVAAFVRLPFQKSCAVPLGTWLLVLLLIVIWLVALPIYVDLTGVSATRGFVADGEHYVFDMTDPLNQARDFHRVSPARWWWLLFCEGSQFYALNVCVGFFLPQVARRIIGLGLRRLRERRARAAELSDATERRSQAFRSG